MNELRDVPVEINESRENKKRGQKRRPCKDMKNSGKNTTLEKVIAKNYLELSGQGFKEHYNLRLSSIQLT